MLVSLMKLLHIWRPFALGAATVLLASIILTSKGQSRFCPRQCQKSWERKELNSSPTFISCPTCFISIAVCSKCTLRPTFESTTSRAGHERRSEEKTSELQSLRH